nr:MAG TPA: hypothetical protein [Bacteriophage sp.]
MLFPSEVRIFRDYSINSTLCSLSAVILKILRIRIIDTFYGSIRKGLN